MLLVLTTQEWTMNAFVEHHKDSIQSSIAALIESC